ncbi:hypothetical protein DRP05_10040 [Archaeoglobales archaeon]|nr:MAG: hypothetical protein DRP05_10040 [Archaeoglobales archaeon]
MTMPVVNELDNIYCIDTLLNNEKNAVCSYIVESEKVCIVDCGPTAAEREILSAIEELGIRRNDVKFIAVTHIHLDHGGGAGRLLKHFPNARVLVHPKGVEHLINPSKLWKSAKSVLGEVADIYQLPEPCEKSRVVVVDDNQTVDLGDCLIKVVHTPGHAPHHVSFYLVESDVLFTGDSAGMYHEGMIVPTTPPPFDFKKSLESIEKMVKLNPKTIAFTHFGFGEGKELHKVYRKTVDWVEIAKSVVEEDGSVEDLRDRIIEQDAEFGELLKLFRNSKIVGMSYMLGLWGLMDCVKRMGGG